MTTSRSQFDVIVVGAGHAGIEAACAAARIGARTALISGNLDTIGKMSCNPAIGGLGKGQLVREVDALGGVMARAADATGIHFRQLGTRKGPAIWSPRAQCDKAAYATWTKHAVEAQGNLLPIQGEVEDLTLHDGAITGIILRDGRTLQAPRVVLTTGTFLRALMHQGQTQTSGGRMGEHAASGLSATLSRLGLDLVRLKTGTPMRIHADSIDLSHCSEQPGDDIAKAFSFANQAPRWGNRIHCWICFTEPAAHQVIRDNLANAPMYNGQIDSTGPRYCPSIEDKVVRFADKQQHQLFLEPEGLDTREVYVNGLSTSLPVAVQDAMLAAIPALRHAHVMRYGYAVEYDAVSTQHLDHRLAVPAVPGLFLAGQINGTSGYEEAAIQGLLAGANAALSLDDAEPLVLSRADGYGGVLVDDLVHCVPEEPYRMFTSRAEHRLHLRADNADRRLSPLARRCGLISAEQAAAVADKAARISDVIRRIGDETRRRIAGDGLDLAAACAVAPTLNELRGDEQASAWIDLRYRGYLERQRSQIERRTRQRDLPLPSDLDYAAIPALSFEGRATLCERRPPTLGAATGLAGVSQADIETLWAWLQRRSSQAAV
ncbi:MAG: tRNA uridine-5-carboxymethylaminomethyl(34) synthesis enzyme MnmG [Planctomycetota bacterium]|jgi:tRNA uridine 5-carboxymethylaminomethyl modification enzyme